MLVRAPSSTERLNQECLSGWEGGISTPTGLPRRGPRLAPLFLWSASPCKKDREPRSKKQATGKPV